MIEKSLVHRKKIFKYIAGHKIVIIKDIYKGEIYMGARMCTTNRDGQTFPTRIGFNLKVPDAKRLAQMML